MSLWKLLVSERHISLLRDERSGKTFTSVNRTVLFCTTVVGSNVVMTNTVPFDVMVTGSRVLGKSVTSCKIDSRKLTQWP